MSRPAPRRSSLADTSPFTPIQPAEPSTSPDEPPTNPTPQPANETSTTRPVGQESERAGSGPKYAHKVSFYEDPADTARIRGAILYTIPQEGPRTLSQFIHHAVMAEVERLENTYNNGRPFPAVGAREMPQDRPLGYTPTPHAGRP